MVERRLVRAQHERHVLEPQADRPRQQPQQRHLERDTPDDASLERDGQVFGQNDRFEHQILELYLSAREVELECRAILDEGVEQPEPSS